MKILFVHQNFPGQFKHLAPALRQIPGVQVRAFAMPKARGLPDIDTTLYNARRSSAEGIHPWVQDIETKVIRGEAAYRAALQARAEGYMPDVIVAHPGWGESLFLKEVWPQARLGLYCEFFYHAQGADEGFDPEFPSSADNACRLLMKNANQQLQFPLADAGLAPTQWQRSLYPEPFRSRISVVHEGIDTDALAPRPGVTVTLGEGITIGRGDEVVTFVNRNLEPARGYHRFMRVLPRLLRERPQARVVIVGADGAGYGVRPPEGRTWKQIFLDEVGAGLDLSRVHFVGSLPYTHYLALLQVSAVHVYLTYPFVLSWSLLEAMSVGCAIVGSDTAPVREVVHDGETGRLVDFFDPVALADAVADLLARPQERVRLGTAARAHVRQHVDLKTVCLPGQLAWLQGLMDTAA